MALRSSPRFFSPRSSFLKGEEEKARNFIGKIQRRPTWSRDAARTFTERGATRGTETVERPARASAAGRRVAATERAIVSGSEGGKRKAKEERESE